MSNTVNELNKIQITKLIEEVSAEVDGQQSTAVFSGEDVIELIKSSIKTITSEELNG